MGTLTEQMENLAADIVSGREGRSADLSTIRGELSALREEIAELREQNEAWIEENRAWVGALKEEVEEMRDRNRAWIEDNRASVEGLKEEVGDMLKEVSADLLGARQAWQEATGRPGARPARAKKIPSRQPTARSKTRSRRARNR
jgi:chromosome segregation ATPase